MIENSEPIQLPLIISWRIRRWRLASWLVLALGLVGAGTVYWLGTRSDNLADDPAMTGFNRASARQMAVLYGKQGRLVEDLSDALKRPGTQAILIVGAATVVALGGFRVAHVLEEEARETAAAPGTPHAETKPL